MQLVYEHFKSQDANIQNKIRNHTFFVLKIILKTFRCDLKSTGVVRVQSRKMDGENGTGSGCGGR